MSKQQEQQLDPNVQPTPSWPGDAQIEMYGAEWDAIFNFINSVAPAYAACSSIMNRGVLNGVISMKFDRVDPATGQATPLSPEEAKPYEDQFADTIKKAKELASQAVKKAKDEQPPLEPPSQEGLPVLDAIVDANGSPISSDNHLKSV